MLHDRAAARRDEQPFEDDTGPTRDLDALREAPRQLKALERDEAHRLLRGAFGALSRDKRELLVMALMGAMFFGGLQLIFSHALAFTTSSRGALAYTTSPFMTFSVIPFSTSRSPNDLCTSFIAMIG